ncbi:general substrate transporter [Fusarium subglutinans]|uniref:General substrate transporter n=1 Tax=Gibberella subglutinans TaxID=42677 RepID=A0A8H5PWE3_GIBSU|nr:general substrate transporter [Fusarium subglutinans]KAF5603808.1 general substrate transporter [Fusarium subglutinans]
MASSGVTNTMALPPSPVDTKRWLKSPNLRTLNFLMMIPLLSIFSQGFDGSMMNGLQSVSHWQTYFGTPTGAMLGFFNAAYPLGGIMGTFLISPAADTFGRRWGLATGAALCCIGAAIQGAAMNIAMFIISRVIIGAGSVVVAGVGAPYITEIAHPAQRTATALFLTFYSVRSIIAGWCTFGTFRIKSTASWRIPSALQGLPSVVQLLFVWFVPESPLWLVSKGRNDEALQMLAKYHGEGDSSDPVVQFEYNEILETLSAEASEHNNIVVFLKDLGSTPGNRRRMFIMVWAAICSQMSGNAFVSYYLSPILHSVGLNSDFQQTLINATNQMLSWFSAIYFATLPAKVGRRKLFLWSLTAIWVIDICIAAGSAVFAKDNTNKAAAYTVVAFLYLFSPAYNLGFNGNLGLYIPEILPYRMRTKGLSFFYFVQFCFMMLSTFVVPIGLGDITWKFYIIFVVWVMVEFVGVYLVFPETKGPSLEEIAWIFDGPQVELMCILLESKARTQPLLSIQMVRNLSSMVSAGTGYFFWVRGIMKSYSHVANVDEGLRGNADWIMMWSDKVA